LKEFSLRGQSEAAAMATRPAACPACGGHGDTGDISVVNDWPDVTPIAASELAVIGTYRSNLCCQAPPSATVSASAVSAIRPSNRGDATTAPALDRD